MDDDTAIALLQARLDRDDPTLTATEVVLLRRAIDQIDDWLLWLDEHTASTHGGDPSSPAVLQVIVAVRRKLARELALVDLALTVVEP